MPMGYKKPRYRYAAAQRWDVSGIKFIVCLLDFLSTNRHDLRFLILDD